MSDYRRCPHCRENGWFDRPFGNHTCSPVWEARLFGAGDDEWLDVRADDAETAAEKFCDQYDSGGDYDIIRSGSAEVEVRKPGEEAITLWDISAESVPEYHAYPRRTPQESGRE
jgi:hypothetical protein